MQNHTLEQRLISGVYGVNNLYRDASSQDVDEVEKKLSLLENTSARILRDIHDTLDKPRQGTGHPTFSINRGDLEQLRKFLFVMHYRNDMLSMHYFSPDHPENAPVREKLKGMMKKLNLKTPAEMWLHFMRYYLDTPHSQIELDAIQGMPSSADGETLMDLAAHQFNSLLNPDMENGIAVTYQTQVGGMYLNIVQAAPGEEFVLGHNTFGLWEGIIDGMPAIHRLYVISPRIAFLLRKNLLRPQYMEHYGDRILSACRSDLLEIHLPGAVSSKSFGPNESNTVQNMLNYKASGEAKNDRFWFPITRLTKRQTYLVNATVMVNVRPQGSLTFLTPQIMRSTVRALWRDKDPRHRMLERYRYIPLIHRLTSSLPVIAGDVTKPATKVIRLPAPPEKPEIEQVQNHANPSSLRKESSPATTWHPANEMKFPSSLRPPCSIMETVDKALVELFTISSNLTQDDLD